MRENEASISRIGRQRLVLVDVGRACNANRKGKRLLMK